jgi:hypothetical protein
MSQENVEKVKSFIDAYNRRDFDAAVADFHPQLDWILPERQAFDSARGIKGVIRFWDGIDETFDDLRLRPQEHVDCGDRIATRLRHYGRGKASGAEIDQELFHQVATFEDGVIVRMEYFESWDQALEAAGVREDAASR